MREIRTHGLAGRGLETGSRRRLHGHEAGNGGYGQGRAYRTTAPALDPTAGVSSNDRMDSLLRLSRHHVPQSPSCKEKEESMEEHTVVAVDVAKDVFEVAVSTNR